MGANFSGNYKHQAEYPIILGYLDELDLNEVEGITGKYLSVLLIELEWPSDKLFTKKLTPARKLQGAIGQVNDWGQWIKSNHQTFLNTCFTILRGALKYPDTTHNGTFIYTESDQIENLWDGFGGCEHCTIEYLIVIGRWSQLSKEERVRLIYLNTQYQHLNLRIRTYDNLVRKAIDGPKFFW